MTKNSTAERQGASSSDPAAHNTQQVAINLMSAEVDRPMRAEACRRVMTYLFGDKAGPMGELLLRSTTEAELSDEMISSEVKAEFEALMITLGRVEHNLSRSQTAKQDRSLTLRSSGEVSSRLALGRMQDLVSEAAHYRPNSPPDLRAGAKRDRIKQFASIAAAMLFGLLLSLSFSFQPYTAAHALSIVQNKLNHIQQKVQTFFFARQKHAEDDDGQELVSGPLHDAANLLLSEFAGKNDSSPIVTLTVGKATDNPRDATQPDPLLTGSINGREPSVLTATSPQPNRFNAQSLLGAPIAGAGYPIHFGAAWPFAAEPSGWKSPSGGCSKRSQTNNNKISGIAAPNSHQQTTKNALERVWASIVGSAQAAAPKRSKPDRKSSPSAQYASISRD